MKRFPSSRQRQAGFCDSLAWINVVDRMISLAVRYAGISIVLVQFGALAGCALFSPSDAMRADVSLSPDCVAEGSYRLYNSRGELQATGQFRDGHRDGLWTFWDSRGTKIVELTYVRGAREGAYGMWYGSFAYPASAGNRKLAGKFSGNREEGEKWVWWPGGNPQCRVEFNDGEATDASCWAEDGEAVQRSEALEATRHQSEADADYIHALDELVERSLWDQCKDKGHASAQLPPEMLRD